MNFDEKNNSEVRQQEDNNVQHDEDAMYLSAEGKELNKQSSKQTQINFPFTRVLRINSMLKNAKVVHKNS